MSVTTRPRQRLRRPWLAAIALVLAACAGGERPVRVSLEGLEGIPVTLGQDTRHALPGDPTGAWTVDLTLPHGHLVLAWGWRSRRDDAPGPFRIRASFTTESGRSWEISEKLLSKPTEPPTPEAWAEKVLKVPDDLAGQRGELQIEIAPRGRGLFGRHRGIELYAAVPAPVPVRREAAQPNIILISFDTLRSDGLGCYGNPRATGPTLDRLAAEGARCANAFATSNWTLPSHYSMLTSLYPSAHGVNPDRAGFGGFRRPTHRVQVSGSRAETTLAERLAGLGFLTAAITEDGWVHPRFGFDQGFVSFVADTQEKLASTWQRTLSWIREHRELPFFLFVHTYQTHQPYDQPAPYDTLYIDPSHVGYALPGRRVPIEFLEDFQPGFYPPMAADVRAFRALYDGEVRYLDDFVAALLETLETEGLDRDTVLVLTSDHGEEIFEHGRFGHGDALYDEVQRVPLIFWAPDYIRPGVQIRSGVSILDIFPTLVELAGGEPGGQEQGITLLPFLRGGREQPAPRMLFAEGFGKESVPMICLWSGRDKYILSLGSPDAKEELYDLSVDPGERIDLAVRYPQKLAAYREQVGAWLEANRELRSRFGVAEEAIDEQVLERLRALGYIE